MREEGSKIRVASLVGAGIGLLYGISIRLAAAYPKSIFGTSFSVMSVAFLFFVPFAMGFATSFWLERGRRVHFSYWLLAPLPPMAIAGFAMLLLNIEGVICIFFYLPIGAVLGAIGGLIGGATARGLSNIRGQAVFACVMVLPLAVGFGEQGRLREYEVRRVENSIDIAAPPERVWRHIERVSAIDAKELSKSWTQRIGFPRPLEATLSYEGVGGVRHASFERGVLFVETVDVWEPERRLAFSIHADKIPPTTLDDHVTIGGEYFDVLRGEYRIERLGEARVRLHLTSETRVSTDFNWYAHWWSDAVMRDVQREILQVIRKRCEG